MAEKENFADSNLGAETKSFKEGRIQSVDVSFGFIA